MRRVSNRNRRTEHLAASFFPGVANHISATAGPLASARVCFGTYVLAGHMCLHVEHELAQAKTLKELHTSGDFQTMICGSCPTTSTSSCFRPRRSTPCALTRTEDLIRRGVMPPDIVRSQSATSLWKVKLGKVYYFCPAEYCLVAH